MDVPSTKPYLIRALHEWCADNGYTAYISVAVNAQTSVPPSFVKDGQITLNINAEATQHLSIGNEAIRFAARFGGVPMNISVPIEQVLAIYARENGVGMGFPVAEGESGADASHPDSDPAEQPESGGVKPEEAAPKAVRPGKASLKRIK